MSQKAASKRPEKDLTETMEMTMQEVHGRFQAISDQLFSKNEMGSRIEDLEKNVADLMTQAGMDEQPASK